MKIHLWLLLLAIAAIAQATQNVDESTSTDGAVLSQVEEPQDATLAPRMDADASGSSGHKTHKTYDMTMTRDKPVDFKDSPQSDRPLASKPKFKIVTVARRVKPSEAKAVFASDQPRNKTDSEIEAELRLKPVVCNRNARYRTMDGSCNNIHNPCWGRAGETYGRLLPPHYGDGFATPREGHRGYKLPNPRLVSRIVQGEKKQSKRTESPIFTDMLTHFGQLMAHEISSAAPYTDKDIVDGKLVQTTPKCCHVEDPDDECNPIEIDFGDDFYPSGHCIELVRSQPYNASETSCPKNSPNEEQREQLNRVTSFIDASLIYGNSDLEAQKIRDEGGKLKIDESSKYIPKGLLPRGDEGQCHSYLPGCDSQCFKAGDIRASLTPILGALQTLFVRHHNYIVDELAHKEWPSDKLYQVARKIVGAMFQVIIYKEYLPLMLGPYYMEEYDLNVPTPNYYYNHSLNPSLFNAWAAAACRVSHSNIPDKLKREGQSCYKTPRLAYDINTMDEYCKPQSDPVRTILVGATQKRMQDLNTVYSREVTNFLFTEHPNQPGKDLFAIDTHRARDHGVPAYNYWRSYCGLKPMYSFDEMKKHTDSYELVNRLQVIYNNRIEDLDFLVGALLEKPEGGSYFGPTVTCLFGQQFSQLKRGDRFWFENLYHPGAFTKLQIEELMKVTLAGLICRNTDVTKIQHNVFLVAGTNNPLKSCKEILAEEDINYTSFK